MWAWCSGGCARWYYLSDRQEPLCPVCLSLPTAYTAENPAGETQPEPSASPAMSAHCPRCSCWFRVEDASLDASFLCPVCLVPADESRWEGAQPVAQSYPMDVQKD